MKVAVCFSGHLRTYKSTFDNIKEQVLDELQPDVFVHTWSQIGTTTSSSRKGIHHFKKYSQEKFDKIELDKIMNTYFKPKAYLIENQKIIDFNITNLLRMRSMIGDHDRFYFQLYSFYKANELKKQYEKKHKFKYDMVIRLRPDIMYPEGIPFDKMNVKENKLYVSDSRNGTFPELRDAFAIGNSFVIDKYCEAYKKVDQYLEDGCVFTAESFINRSMYYNNIKVMRIPEFKMIRVKGRVGKPNKYIEFLPALTSKLFIIKSDDVRYILKAIEKIRDNKLSKNPKALKIPDRDIFFIVSKKKNVIKDEVMKIFNEHYALQEFIIDKKVKGFQPFKRKEVQI